MTTGTYWTLSGFYACYFAVLGVWIPFWPLYMSHLGHNAEAIGLLTALALGIKVLAPPIWGGLADRGSRHRVIVFTSFAAAVTASMFLFGTTLSLLLIATGIYSFFHTGPLALVEVTTLEVVTRHNADYGRVRLWGSWGFILLSLAMGQITDYWGLGMVPGILVLLLLMGGILSLFLPQGETHPQQIEPGARRLFRRPEVRWFYLTTLLMQLSHGAYYGFMSIHLHQNGFSKTAIGLLWSLGVLAEVAFMMRTRPLLLRFGLSAILTGSLILASLRWGIYALTLYWPLLIIGQLLHGATFGAFHVASVQRVFEMAPHGTRATAQAWYSALSFGVGGGDRPAEFRISLRKDRCRTAFCHHVGSCRVGGSGLHSGSQSPRPLSLFTMRSS
ncbi:MAG: MFS transporter [Magnetococcales bacterium]|nr:MFS transporter [Magnetococcales bacterium]